MVKESARVIERIEQKQNHRRILAPSIASATLVILLVISSIFYFQPKVDTNTNLASNDNIDEIILVSEYLRNQELVSIIAEEVNLDYTEIYGVNIESAENYFVSNMNENEIIEYLDDNEQENFLNYVYSEYLKKNDGEV